LTRGCAGKGKTRSLLSIFKKPVFDAGCVRCAEPTSRADTPRMPTSTFAEPASCAAVICIFQFPLRNTEGAVDVRLREAHKRGRQRPPPSHFTLVCVYHPSVCTRGSPAEKIPPLSWTTITTSGYRKRGCATPAQRSLLRDASV